MIFIDVRLKSLIIIDHEYSVPVYSDISLIKIKFNKNNFLLNSY